MVEGDDRISTTLSPRKNLDAIRSYYFVDKESNVKIYIKEEACLSMEHELKWTPTSVRYVLPYPYHEAYAYLG